MIICTAGHIDHGKTSLLQALTGKHTARLPEEKKRGLTIDLGYAYLPIEGDILGFIDVPGHQKFLSNMLAGLGGLEHAMLVVSAEEGIKPQTEEHLAILQLLDFKHIVVVITKADRAQAAQIEMLQTLLASRLPQASCFVTSAKTGEGVELLKQRLISLNRQSRECERPFRYAIDRVFHIKGAGLVVTGTALAGRVAVGDELHLSGGETVRVKAIHAQNQENSQGVAGQRLALNLAGVEKAHLARGDWLCQLAPQYPCDRLTVQLRTAVSLKESQVAHLYHFASHITGKVTLLQGNGQQDRSATPLLAEILLDSPQHIAVGDKLIVRSGDDSQTLAGAQVLEIHSPKRHKRTPERLAYLHALCENGGLKPMSARLPHYLASKPCHLAALCWAEQIFPQQAVEFGEKIANDWLVSQVFFQQLQAKIVEKLAEYHLQHNDQLGVTKARLHRMAALEQPEAVVYQAISQLFEQGRLCQTRGWVHTPEHRIAFSSEEQTLWEKVRPLFAATQQALWVRDIASQLSVDETVMRNLLYKAGKLGYLVPIVKDRFLLHEQILDFAARIKAFIAIHGGISVNQLRDELAYGRKLTVQLIEYFDRSGFLRRKGDVHLLRDSDTY